MKKLLDSEFLLCLAAGYFMPVVVIGYALSRGLAKKGEFYKNGFKTREFWLSVLAAGWTYYNHSLVLSASIVIGYMVSRGLAKLKNAKINATPILHI